MVSTPSDRMDPAPNVSGGLALRLRDWLGVRGIVAVVYVALHALWVAAGPRGESPATRSLVADAFLAPVFLCVAIASWRVARRPALGRRASLAWRWLALAYVLLW